MTRNRAILAAASITAVLLVAGCDSDEPASPSPEPTQTSASPEASATPSPSPTPTVKAPEPPKAMDDDGPAGAEAAAVYFLELDPYIMKTGDTAEYEAMSHKTCDYCASRLDQAKQIAERGDIFTGGARSARITQTYEQDSATGIWPLDARVDDKKSRITDSSGKVLLDTKADVGDLRLEMTRKGDGWVVVGVADVPD